MIIVIDTLRQTYSIGKSTDNEELCATSLSLLLEIDAQKDHRSGNLTVTTGSRARLERGPSSEITTVVNKYYAGGQEVGFDAET